MLRDRRCLAVRTDQFEDSDRARFVADRLGRRLADEGHGLEPLPLAGRREAPEVIRWVGPADVLDAAHGLERRRDDLERIEMDAGSARGVRVDGVLLQAEHVVVAAGALETPGLLARSQLRRAALGRYLSYHPVLIGQVVLDRAGNSDGSRDPLPRLCIPPSPERPWFTMLLRDTNPLEPTGEDRDVDANSLIEIRRSPPSIPTRPTASR